MTTRTQAGALVVTAGGLVAAFLLMVDPGRAEARDPADVEVWADAGFRLRMPKRLSATFTQNLRFDDRVSRLGVVAPEVAVGYRALKWWRLEAGYRYEYERDNDAVFQHRHRIFANTRFRLRLKPVDLELRLQWQEQLRAEEDDGTAERHILRTRALAALRKVPVVDPYASVEMFQRLDGLDNDLSPGTVQKLRVALGVEWDLGPVELDLRYMLVCPIDDDQDPFRHIIAVGGRFDWAPWRKKRKKAMAGAATLDEPSG